MELQFARLLAFLICLAVGASAQIIDAPCNFVATSNGYTCQLRGVYLEANETLNIIANHEADQTDADVLRIDFYFSRINYVPNQIFSRFSNLQTLNMNSAYMQTIRPDSFDGADSLTDFGAIFNGISNLPANAFQGAPNLVEITLVFNDIAVIHETAFNGLSRLTRLNLDQNKIESLESQTLSPLVNLQHLTLANNLLQRLPANLFSNSGSLASILLFNNQIEEVHFDAFNGLTSLDTLELSRNRLTRIDGRLFNSSRLLRVLYLNQNNIEAIQSNFIDNLNHLEWMNLSGNECIDEEFENIASNRADVLRSLERCFAGFGHVKSFHIVLDAILEMTEI